MFWRRGRFVEPNGYRWNREKELTTKDETWVLQWASGTCNPAPYNVVSVSNCVHVELVGNVVGILSVCCRYKHLSGRYGVSNFDRVVGIRGSYPVGTWSVQLLSRRYMVGNVDRVVGKVVCIWSVRGRYKLLSSWELLHTIVKISSIGQINYYYYYDDDDDDYCCCCVVGNVDRVVDMWSVNDSATTYLYFRKKAAEKPNAGWHGVKAQWLAQDKRSPVTDTYGTYRDLSREKCTACSHAVYTVLTCALLPLRSSNTLDLVQSWRWTGLPNQTHLAQLTSLSVSVHFN